MTQTTSHMMHDGRRLGGALGWGGVGGMLHVISCGLVVTWRGDPRIDNSIWQSKSAANRQPYDRHWVAIVLLRKLCCDLNDRKASNSLQSRRGLFRKPFVVQPPLRWCDQL